ncbi:methyl-accepting chemotaxis protein [Kordiimonas sp.]|uniref:methyl-accepting chemotaxis protein n=1 Tax=Kordiimonas sp. TaxID=1970157 RepID=UPI003A90B2B7
MDNLSTIRTKVVKVLLSFLWAHVPAAFVHGWWADSGNTLWVAGTIALFALLATLVVRTSGEAAGRMGLAFLMVLTVGALVSLYAGHPWQKDVHLYFATVIALMSSTFCWRTLAVASGTTMLYLFVMNLAAPHYLYGTEGSILEVGFETLAFGVLSVGLLWVTNLVRDLFQTAAKEHENALSEAERAREAGSRAEYAAKEAQEAAVAAESARHEAESLRAQQAENEKQASLDKRAILEGIAQEFELTVQQIVHEVVSMSKDMKSTASSLQGHAQEGMQSAEKISWATEDASSNVDAVSGAATELSGSTSEIAQQVDKTNQLTYDAVSQSESVAERISILSERAREIESVVSLITEIAEQTNLLALNATIEAARAGEVGRGFAVVATEVKNLAGESARAADGIHERIAAVQEATNAAVDAISAINEVIRNINAGATAIAAAVEEQDAATRDIAQSVQKASDGSRSAAENAKRVEEKARQSEMGAMTVLAAIEQLETLADSLSGQTDSFLVQIRAGA